MNIALIQESMTAEWAITVFLGAFFAILFVLHVFDVIDSNRASRKMWQGRAKNIERERMKGF